MPTKKYKVGYIVRGESGPQPQLFEPIITYGINKISWSHNSKNGAFDKTMTAKLGLTDAVSPLTITPDLDGKTLQIVTTGDNFKTNITNISLKFTPSGLSSFVYDLTELPQDYNYYLEFSAEGTMGNVDVIYDNITYTLSETRKIRVKLNEMKGIINVPITIVVPDTIASSGSDYFIAASIRASKLDLPNGYYTTSYSEPFYRTPTSSYLCVSGSSEVILKNDDVEVKDSTATSLFTDRLYIGSNDTIARVIFGYNLSGLSSYKGQQFTMHCVQKSANYLYYADENSVRVKIYK